MWICYGVLVFQAIMIVIKYISGVTIQYNAYRCVSAGPLKGGTEDT